MTRLLLGLLLLVPLVGCGRAGPPKPPGPREQITYPQAYPRPDPAPVAGQRN
jgi:predicted small lipoprotein YifL